MLNQASGYALNALAFIAAMGGKPVLVRVAAEACGAPPAYLAKIIHLLGRQRIVHTQRGVGGGVCLTRPANEIPLADVCRALDDPILKPRCLLGNTVCSGDRACPAHNLCTDYREQLSEFLERTTIADLAAFETRRRWATFAKSPDDSTEPRSPRDDRPDTY